MIYQKPRYRLAGERHLLVEFGDEVDLTMNFRAIAFAQKLLQSPEVGPNGIRAVVDAVPSFTTVLIQYNPSMMMLQGLIQLCDYYLQQLERLDNLELPSRLIEIPVAYHDRWTHACFEQYCRTIKPIESNPEFIAQLNGFRSVDELVAYHVAPEWWVGAVGFMAGLPTLMPLDPNFRLHAPKYDPPRVWTPKGTIGVGGGFTTIYPIVVPDGYQMIGRTPLPIFNPKQQRSPFQNTPFLFRVGDRVKFRAISEDEFELIEQQAESGCYEYQISAPQPFRLCDDFRSTLAVA